MPPPPGSLQDHFRHVMEAYFGEASRVSFKLLEAFCRALAIPLDSMHHLFDVRGRHEGGPGSAREGREHGRRTHRCRCTHLRPSPARPHLF